MTETVTIAKRLIPLEHIALLEPFSADELSRIKTDRPFKTRVVLLNRESVLSEEELEAFAAKYGFRMLLNEGIAANPLVAFSVEAFEPQEGFSPTKPYRSRLMWKDQTGEGQSRLLLAGPQDVLTVIVRGQAGAVAEGNPVRRSRRTRKRSNSPAPD